MFQSLFINMLRLLHHHLWKLSPNTTDVVICLLMCTACLHLDKNLLKSNMLLDIVALWNPPLPTSIVFLKILNLFMLKRYRTRKVNCKNWYYVKTIKKLICFLCTSGMTAEHANSRQQFGQYLSEFGQIQVIIMVLHV